MAMTRAEISRRYRARHPGAHRAAFRRGQRAWKARNLKVVRNHNRILQRVRYHVSVGHLVKTPCGVCGELKVQAHHYLGYARAHELDVEWLCARHHREAHEAHPELTVMKAVA